MLICSGYGNVAPYNNAARQERVNNIAEYVGASSGTYRKDGVPGTDRGVTGYGHHGQGYGGNYGHGYNGHYGNGFGNRHGFGHGYTGY